MSARRVGVERYPSGRIKASEVKPQDETAEEIVSVVKAQRIKLVGMDLAERRLAGSALGRLFLRGVLDAKELRGAEQYARIVNTYCRVKGFPSRTPKSMSLAGGRSGGRGYEPTEQDITDATEEYHTAFRILLTTERSVFIEGRKVPCRDLLERIAIDDEPESELTAFEIMGLKHACRVLGSHFETGRRDKAA